MVYTRVLPLFEGSLFLETYISTYTLAGCEPDSLLLHNHSVGPVSCSSVSADVCRKVTSCHLVDDRELSRRNTL